VKTFDLYGETATLENYKLKMGLAFDAKFRKFSSEAGTGVTLWAVSIKESTILPPPLLENSPRTVSKENLRTGFNFYAFALFKVMDSEKMIVAGSAAGFAGRFSHQRFELEDKSPFASSDINGHDRIR
jgi:hypothetical protein